MKHREFLASAATVALLSACGPEEVVLKPDADFAKPIPVAVSQYENAVVQVTDGNNEGTAVVMGNVALTAKHVVDTCESGIIANKEAQDGYEAQAYDRKSHRDLASLTLNGKFGSGPWPEFAPELPKAGERGYFITYQGDNASSEGRGPDRTAPFDRPATYMGLVAKSTPEEVSYAVPTTLGDVNILEGASGAPVFNEQGKVISIVSKSGKTPLSAETINDELGSFVPEGYYELLTTIPVSTDVFKADSTARPIC